MSGFFCPRANCSSRIRSLIFTVPGVLGFTLRADGVTFLIGIHRPIKHDLDDLLQSFFCLWPRKVTPLPQQWQSATTTHCLVRTRTPPAACTSASGFATMSLARASPLGTAPNALMGSAGSLETAVVTVLSASVTSL